MIRKLAAAAAILALAACATPEQTADATSASNRDCFRAQDVNGYEVVDEHRVKARVGVSREYLLTISQNTRYLDWTHALALESPTSFICVGSGGGARIIGGEPRMTMLITDVARVPDETPAGS